MTVKEQVFNLLNSKDWISCEDMEQLFPPLTEGHLSWPQRLRELRAEGYIIEKRRKYKHTFEYRLVKEPVVRYEGGQGMFA